MNMAYHVSGILAAKRSKYGPGIGPIPHQRPRRYWGWTKDGRRLMASDAHIADARTFISCVKSIIFVFTQNARYRLSLYFD
jgi:hypothetical protein